MKRYLTHLAKREESHPLSIGREKRLRRVLGVGNGCGRLLVEKAQIELRRFAGSRAGIDNLRAVGRNRKWRPRIGVKDASQRFGEEGEVILKAPWISAWDQGLVISLLVRGYRFTGGPGLLQLLQRASRIFALEVHEGGVRELLSSGVFYTEKPGHAVPGILDGFMTALLGLYDLFVETKDPAVGQLFTDGIEGLKTTIATWDYRKRWSWYGSREYLSPPAYHQLNRMLLEVLGRLSAVPLFTEYAENWRPDRLSMLGRIEIYLGFLITKNACRARNRTWGQSRNKIRALASREAKATS